MIKGFNKLKHDNFTYNTEQIVLHYNINADSIKFLLIFGAFLKISNIIYIIPLIYKNNRIDNTLIKIIF